MRRLIPLLCLGFLVSALGVARADTPIFAPTGKLVLTSSSATACTNVPPQSNNADFPGRYLFSITYNGSSTMAGTISFYAGEGGAPTCNANDLVWGPLSLSAGQTVLLGPMYMGNGIAYSLSQALSSNFVVSFR